MFDAYYHWLGIPPHEQPPNEYRLLGLPPFAADATVIANAAAQRTAQLQSQLNGPYRDEAQRLLDEVAAARLCLLNPTLKASYDQELWTALYGALDSLPDIGAPAPQPSPLAASYPAPVPVPPPAPPAFDVANSPAPATVRSTSIQRSRRRHGPLRVLLSIVIGGLNGLALGWLVLAYLRPQFDYWNWFHAPRAIAHAAPVPNDNPPPALPIRPPNHSPARPQEPTTHTTNVRPPASNLPVNPPSANHPAPVENAPAAGVVNKPVVNPPATNPQELAPAGDGTEMVPVPENATTTRLMALARESRVAAEQSKLLKAALRRAIADQEVPIALEALMWLANEHSANEFDLTLDTLQSLDRSDLPPADQKQIAAHGVALLERLPANDARAQPLAVITLQAARAARDVQLVRQATLAMIAVQEAGPPGGLSTPVTE